MTRHLLVLAIGLAFASGGAQAAGKIYRCKNADGSTYYSQAFDPRLCTQGGSQLNDQGLAVKQIERPKTEEELAALKAQAALEAEEKARAEELAREDQVLLMSFASEADLQRTHDQQMQSLETAIATTNLQLANQQKSLSDLLASAAESERANQPVSESLAASIATVRKAIEEENTYIARKEAQKAEAAVEFEKKLAHYREVVARQTTAKH